MPTDKGKGKMEGVEGTASGSKKGASILDDFTQVQDSLYQSLVRLTRTANSCPESSDLAFARSMDKSVRKKLDKLVGRSTRTMEDIYKLGDSMSRKRSGQTSSSSTSSKKKKQRQNDFSIETLARHPAFLTDLVDNLLEQTDYYLDVHSGKRAATLVGRTLLPTKSKAKVVMNDPNLEKPQLKFLDKVDNGKSASSSSQVEEHPYANEIQCIVYPVGMFGPSQPIFVPESLAKTKFTFIDTAEKLTDLVRDIQRSVKSWTKAGKTAAIAIDLEHHSLRSYQGLVCLMQLTVTFDENGTTIQHDYVIDTLVPQVRNKMSAFGPVFTDTKIVKVFHGAESDIEWLQKDFNLYIVNLFDTYHATNVLELEGHSLSYLLKTIVNHDSDKRYQLADWRLRPLPQEMLEYARYDTHYLLVIYERLRQALLARADEVDPTLAGTDLTRIPRTSAPPTALTNQHGRAAAYDTSLHPMHTVLAASNTTALRRYKSEVYDFENGSGSMGWAKVLLKGSMGRPLGPTAFEIFRRVHRWRDQVAREEDESNHFVISNFSLFTLAERQPTTSAGVLAACQPSSPILRTRVDELIEIVKEVQKQNAINQPTTTRPNSGPETSAVTKSHSENLPTHAPLNKTGIKPDVQVQTGLDSSRVENGTNGPLPMGANLTSSKHSTKANEEDRKRLIDQTASIGRQNGPPSIKNRDDQKVKTSVPVPAVPPASLLSGTPRMKFDLVPSPSSGRAAFDAVQKRIAEQISRECVATSNVSKLKLGLTSTDNGTAEGPADAEPAAGAINGTKEENNVPAKNRNAGEDEDDDDSVLYIGGLQRQGRNGNTNTRKPAIDPGKFDFTQQDPVLKLPSKPTPNPKKRKNQGQEGKPSPAKPSVKTTPSGKRAKLSNSAPVTSMTFIDGNIKNGR